MANDEIKEWHTAHFISELKSPVEADFGVIVLNQPIGLNPRIFRQIWSQGTTLGGITLIQRNFEFVRMAAQTDSMTSIRPIKSPTYISQAAAVDSSFLIWLWVTLIL
jgi:hypothetical protein